MTRMLTVRPERSGWRIFERESGAAGHVDVRLTHVTVPFRVSVDALDPDILIDLLVPADATTGAPSTGYLPLLRTLFGQGLVAALTTRVVEVAVEDTAGWAAVAAAGAVLLRTQGRQPVTRLAGLHALREPALSHLPETEELREDLVWNAVPAVMGLARIARRAPEVLDRLSAAHRQDLLLIITTTRDVLRGGGWSGAGEDELSDLAALLSPVAPVVPAAWSMASALRDGVAGTGPSQWRWQSTADELRPRLGSLADLTFAGCTAEGRLPGTVDVRVPLRPGVDSASAEGWTVRLVTARGEVLAAGNTSVRRPPSGVAYAQCRLHVPVPVEDEDSVLLDISLPSAAGPSGDELRRAARRRAARYGRDGVLGELRGDPGRSAAWELCAASLRAAGEAEAASQAALRARPAPGVRDWLGELEQSLLVWASAESVDAAASVERLEALHRDLTAVLDPVPETARTHEALSQLLENADSRDHEDSDDPQARARAHLDIALALYLQLGDETSVNRVLGKRQASGGPAGT